MKCLPFLPDGLFWSRFFSFTRRGTFLLIFGLSPACFLPAFSLRDAMQPVFALGGGRHSSGLSPACCFDASSLPLLLHVVCTLCALSATLSDTLALFFSYRKPGLRKCLLHHVSAGACEQVCASFVCVRNRFPSVTDDQSPPPPPQPMPLGQTQKHTMRSLAAGDPSIHFVFSIFSLRNIA